MSTYTFGQFAQSDPTSIAVIDQIGREWSRGELFSEINRLSRALRATGISPGDCLAIFAPNCAEYLQTYLAATQVGLYVVSINPQLARSETAYILGDSHAKILVAHQAVSALARATVDSLESPPAVLLAIGNIPGFTALREFCEAHSLEPLQDPIPGRPLTYTSATTGRPKGVELPLNDSESALQRIIQAHARNGILPGRDHVHLCASMLYHAAPLEWSAIALHMGHRVILVDRWHAELLLQLIETHRVTTTFMVPAMFVRILKLPEDVRRRYSTSSLRFVAHGAAPCPLEVKQSMIDWWGPVIWESYGSSEGSGTIVSSTDWLQHPGTVGRPFAGCELKVLDDEGEEVPPGVTGIIYMTRYTGDTFRYRGDPEKTRAAHRGRFFTVGDIGYLDAEGYLFLCDRKIDMIISGGMNIYPAEIERVLIQHPQIADCAVIGIPDELMGEAVKAIIELQAGTQPTSVLKADILRFLATRLSPAKLPRRLEFTAALPRDPNGKIYKRHLREVHWSAQGRRL